MNVDYVVDIGNTRLKWGRCVSGAVIDMAAFLPTDRLGWEAYWNAWNIDSKQTWQVAGVNSENGALFWKWLRDKSESAHAWHGEVPLKMLVDNPEQTGVDRKFNAVAVNARRRPELAAAIVDAGSAVTVDFVDKQGVFLGGSIFPGLRLMARALHNYTAHLPEVEVTEIRKPPGTSTVTAIEVGVSHAVLGGIELIIRGFQARLRDQVEVFYAGGDAEALVPHCPWPATLWPEMTLQGFLLSTQAPFHNAQRP